MVCHSHCAGWRGQRQPPRLRVLTRGRQANSDLAAPGAARESPYSPARRSKRKRNPFTVAELVCNVNETLIGNNEFGQSEKTRFLIVASSPNGRGDFTPMPGPH